MQNKRIGVFAGSFCPVTRGHVDVIEKASALVDKLYVVVGVNPHKHYVLTDEQRLALTKRAVSHIHGVEVVFHEGMMTDFCKKVGANVMIKSVRNASDVQQVIDLCDTNRVFWNGETVFVVGDSKYRHISATLVRELASLGQDISAFVPSDCAEQISSLLQKSSDCCQNVDNAQK